MSRSWDHHRARRSGADALILSHADGSLSLDLERVVALRKGPIGSLAAITDLLFQLLAHDSHALRLAAFHAWRHLLDGEALPGQAEFDRTIAQLLEHHRRDRDPLFVAPGLVEALIQRLRGHSDLSERRKAARALSRLGPSGFPAIPYLLRNTQRSGGSVFVPEAMAWLEALKELTGERVVIREYERDPSVHTPGAARNLLEELEAVRAGAGWLSRHLSVLRHPAGSDEGRFTFCVGDRAEDFLASLRFLASATQDASPRIRRAARATIPRLLEQQADELRSTDLRTAHDAMARCAGLRELAEEPGDGLASVVARQLVELTARVLREDLVVSRNPAVRAWARGGLAALERVQPRRADEAPEELVFTAVLPSDRVRAIDRIAAAFAEKTVGLVFPSAVQGKERKVLEEVARDDPSVIVQRAAGAALELIDRLEEARRRGWSLSDPHLEAGVQEELSIVAAIHQLMSHADPVERAAAALRLGRSPGKGALVGTALELACSDADELVSRIAGESLAAVRAGRIMPRGRARTVAPLAPLAALPKAVEADPRSELVEMLESPDLTRQLYGISALAHAQDSGEDVLAAYFAILCDGPDAARRWVLHALGECDFAPLPDGRDPRASLLLYASGDDAQLRSVAEVALRKHDARRGSGILSAQS